MRIAAEVPEGMEHRLYVFHRALAEISQAEQLAEQRGRRGALIHRLDRVFVDATPDAELAVRILRAYLDYSTVSDNTLGLPPENPLCIAMNEAQGKRNAIIEQAIRALAAGGGEGESDG